MRYYRFQFRVLGGTAMNLTYCMCRGEVECALVEFSSDTFLRLSSLCRPRRRVPSQYHPLLSRTGTRRHRRPLHVPLLLRFWVLERGYLLPFASSQTKDYDFKCLISRNTTIGLWSSHAGTAGAPWKMGCHIFTSFRPHAKQNR